METIAISEFKDTCLALLERNTREPILITRKGTPIAQVVPPPEPEKPRSWFGCMKGAGEIPGAWRSTGRSTRGTGRIPLEVESGEAVAADFLDGLDRYVALSHDPGGVLVNAGREGHARPGHPVRLWWSCSQKKSVALLRRLLYGLLVAKANPLSREQHPGGWRGYVGLCVTNGNRSGGRGACPGEPASTGP
jgi:antitoxin (DNA-binding transcriptional repressor) of toxin-antitoxin stability system